MESESTRPRVPIRVANKPELRKYELSSEGVTCAMMEVVTPVVVAKENKMEFCKIGNDIEIQISITGCFSPSRTIVPPKIALRNVT